MMPTIRELRERAGLSQRELARRVGVHYMTIWNWEANQRGMTAHQLKAVADAFGVRMDDIDLPGTDKERPNAR